VLAFALVLAIIPLSSWAEDTSRWAAKSPLQASVVKAAASAKLAPQAAPAAPDKARPGSTSFFKKPVGVIVLAVVAAGACYGIYSASHNRIHSVTRANQ
jgi:hypothetical protein